MDGLTRRGSRCSDMQAAAPDAGAESASPNTQRDLLQLSSAVPEAPAEVILEAYEAAGRNVWRAEKALLARFGDAPRTTSAGGEAGNGAKQSGSGLLDELFCDPGALSSQAVDWISRFGQSVMAIITDTVHADDTAPTNDRSDASRHPGRAATNGNSAGTTRRTTVPRGASVAAPAPSWLDLVPNTEPSGLGAWGPVVLTAFLGGKND